MQIKITDTKTIANLQGYMAILLWSFSAYFISLTTQLPTLLVAGLSSVAGFSFFAITWSRKKEKLQVAFRQPWQIWLLYFAAVVAYRGFYFAGLKTAPIVEANLLNYLWPLLILLFSSLLDHQRMAKKTYVGAICCFIGIICIGLSKGNGSLTFEAGHIFAILAAITWGGYSVMTRRFPAAPIDMIGLMHFIAAFLFILSHSLFEPPVDWVQTSWTNVFGVLGLGLSMSLGYSLWDRAMTHGSREKVAVAAYYTPLLSTFWLIALGSSHLTGLTLLAAVLILGGSLFARL